MKAEYLPDGHVWLRIADPAWPDPLDPTFPEHYGARWNPPDSFPTLYLNEDLVTARHNLRMFIAPWPYEPEDLRSDNGPVLVEATLPRHQEVADIHTPAGVAAAGLPATYPVDASGETIPHSVCQLVGTMVKNLGLRGIRCRSARTSDGAGREVAWFPATSRSRAHSGKVLSFPNWYWR